MIPTLKHTFTTKHFSHNKNYEWNIPNIHKCYRSQRGTAVTIARAVVLNHLLQVLKWPGHTTWVLCALCRSIHPICTWLVLCCPQGRVQWRGGGVGGGARSQACWGQDAGQQAERRAAQDIGSLRSREPWITVRRHGQGTGVCDYWKHGSYFLRSLSA